MDIELNGYNTEISPLEFELLVRDFLVGTGQNLKKFEVKHNVVLKTYDGDYQIDVFAEFEALNTTIKVLIECKKHKNLIKRETVQILFDKLRATGTHKGIIFSTSGFQSGAQKFALEHGIALITIIDGILTYTTKSNQPSEIDPEFIKLLNLPKFVGEYQYSKTGFYFLDNDYLDKLTEYIFDKN